MKFEFDKVGTSNVFNRFKFDKCLECLVVKCKFVEKSLFHDLFHTVCAHSQRAQTNFILKFNPLHKLQLLNLQHNFCSAMCYTVIIWTRISFTLGNRIVTLLFNWPKPVHYVPTNKINAIRIRIRCILKVKNANSDQLGHITNQQHSWLLPSCLNYAWKLAYWRMWVRSFSTRLTSDIRRR